MSVIRGDPSSVRAEPLVRLLVRAARPRQAVKNVLVLVAPFAAGGLLDSLVMVKAVVAVIAFSAAGAGVYFLNDVIDADVDRVHPTKRLRPVAAGLLSPRRAVVASITLFVVSEVVSLLVASSLAGVIALYIQLQVGYCLWLRRQPVLDICAVALGFVLRITAGAVSTEVPLSLWILLAAAFGSLFLVSGRRYAEMKLREQGGRVGRATLDRYSASYLRFVWSSSATLSILSYLLWSSQNPLRASPVWSGLAAAVFIIAILSYALFIDRGNAGAPEDVAFSNRTLQALAVLWVVAVSVPIYF